MTLTSDQTKALDKLIAFLHKDNKEKIFILRGSAGTGKTTLIKYILENIPEYFTQTNLCAFTNKAVKVIGRKTGKHGSTLHQLLYKVEQDDEKIRFVKKVINAEAPTLCVVDEASMITDRINSKAEVFQSTPLLSDLLVYICSGHQRNKMIFVGDPCQLPPMGYRVDEKAPALEKEYFIKNKKLTVSDFELKEVVRQAEESYILKFATRLRDHILYSAPLERKLTARILENKTSAIKKYAEEYDALDEEKVMVLAWTNVDVNWWNDVIRSRLKLDSDTLQPGTRVVFDRTWTDSMQVIDKSETGIIISTDTEVKHFAGLQFREVTIETTDLTGEKCECTAYAMLDHLLSTNGTLDAEQEKELVHQVMVSNPTYREMPRPWNDPFVGALRLRYGYALTCHKAQGSEFKNVILHPYFPKHDIRWLYTAVTRAQNDLYSYKRA